MHAHIMQDVQETRMRMHSVWKLTFLSMTNVHTYIPTQNEMRSRISNLALRHSATRGAWIMRIHPREPKCTTFCASDFYELLQIACTKPTTMELMGTWMNKSCSTFWPLLEVRGERWSYRAYRIIKEQNSKKNVCIGDALPESATIGPLA